jgi:hypothetical protein
MRIRKPDTATLLNACLSITDSPPVSTPVAARHSQGRDASANNNEAAAAGTESTLAAAAQRYGYDTLQTPQPQGDVSYTYSATPHSGTCQR